MPAPHSWLPPAVEPARVSVRHKSRTTAARGYAATGCRCRDSPHLVPAALVERVTTPRTWRLSAVLTTNSSRRAQERRATDYDCSMPARYRVRLRGRTFTVWDHDERRAVETAHEWLDAYEKLGFRPDAKAEVKRIGDTPHPDDLLGTERP